jgi:hypothetical protein
MEFGSTLIGNQSASDSNLRESSRLHSQRLKESGMYWTETGATSVLNLRLALKSNRWDECWGRLHNSDYLKIKLAA